MHKPLFSVVIPALNEEKFLPKLLESIAKQTYRNFEVVVVDGKSKDKTVMLAKTFRDKIPHLQVTVASKASLPLQRNLGAKKTRGEWLCFFDADGELVPYFFERVKEYIEKTKPELLTTWFKPDTDNPKDSIFTLFGNMVLEGSLLLKRPLPPGPLTLVRRDIYEKVGGYDETHAFHEDVDFGLRLYKLGVRLEILRESLCVWSLRRLRREGTLKVVNQYIISILPVLIMNKSIKFMPGYIMGGQLYKDKKIKIKKPSSRLFKQKFNQFIQEIFE